MESRSNGLNRKRNGREQTIISQLNEYNLRLGHIHANDFSLDHCHYGTFMSCSLTENTEKRYTHSHTTISIYYAKKWTTYFHLVVCRLCHSNCVAFRSTLLFNVIDSFTASTSIWQIDSVCFFSLHFRSMCIQSIHIASTEFSLTLFAVSMAFSIPYCICDWISACTVCNRIQFSVLCISTSSHSMQNIHKCVEHTIRPMND